MAGSVSTLAPADARNLESEDEQIGTRASSDQGLRRGSIESPDTPESSEYVLANLLHSETLPVSLSALLENKVKIRSLLRTYFGTVHQFGFLSFLHEPGFWRLFDRGREPRELTSLMVACTLRFIYHEPSVTRLAQADELFQNAMQALHISLQSRPGVVDLMSLLLARLYESARGYAYSAWMRWGDAVSLMQYLSLHTFDQTYPDFKESPSNPLLRREVLRRLAWAVFYLDTIADGGRHGVHKLTEAGFHIRLPCDEQAFIRGHEVEAPLLSTGDPLGVKHPSLSFDRWPNLDCSAHLIQMSAMRRRILHFNSMLRYSTSGPSQLLHDLSTLEKSLRDALASLKPSFAYTEDNLFYNGDRRTAFIQLHVLRHNAFLMLHKTRLGICSRHTEFTQLRVRTIQERIRHSLSMAGIIDHALRMGVICDPFVAMMGYSALEVLLYDPPSLSAGETTISPTDPVFKKAMVPLLGLIRKIAPVDQSVADLHAHASHRISTTDFADILLPSDIEAGKSALATNHLPMTDDFRASTPSVGEAPMDLGDPMPNLVSRAGSPCLTALDAGSLAPPTSLEVLNVASQPDLTSMTTTTWNSASVANSSLPLQWPAQGLQSEVWDMFESGGNFRPAEQDHPGEGSGDMQDEFWSLFTQGGGAIAGGPT